ncbi:MAG: type I restriction enzyme HsdR N-terminal domain-containing protein [Bacteroidales bacterium]|nr:type I restriction enzyme HsdR N-terminal domain-containing protein [Bacteroidales bacterium]
MGPLNLPTYFFRIKEDRGKKYIFDEIRRRFVLLTPEEWVRQHLVNFLVTQKNFPLSLISVEKGFKNNRRKQRYDLLVFDRKGEPLMMIECKAPGIDINQHVFDQASRYNNKYKAAYMLISNGMNHYCCLINKTSRQYRFLQEIPVYSEMQQGDEQIIR